MSRGMTALLAVFSLAGLAAVDSAWSQNEPLPPKQRRLDPVSAQQRRLRADGRDGAVLRDLWYRFRGHTQGLVGLGWDGPVKVGNGWQDFKSVIALPAK